MDILNQQTLPYLKLYISSSFIQFLIFHTSFTHFSNYTGFLPPSSPDSYIPLNFPHLCKLKKKLLQNQYLPLVLLSHFISLVVIIKILTYFYSLSYLHTICMLIYTLLRYLIIANYPLLLYLRYRKRNMKILVFEAEKRRPIPCCQLLFSHFQRRNAKKQLIPLRRETFSQAKKKER